MAFKMTKESADTIEKEMIDTGREMTDEEHEAYETWQAGGRPDEGVPDPEPEPEPEQDPGSEVKPEENSAPVEPGPDTQPATQSTPPVAPVSGQETVAPVVDTNSGADDAVLALANKPLNQLTKEESDMLLSAMDRVGARTVEELPGKIKGLEQQMGSHGQEVGNLRTENENLRRQLSEIQSFQSDMRNNTPQFQQFLNTPEGHQYLSQNQVSQQQQVGVQQQGLPVQQQPTMPAVNPSQPGQQFAGNVAPQLQPLDLENIPDTILDVDTFQALGQQINPLHQQLQQMSQQMQQMSGELEGYRNERTNGQAAESRKSAQNKWIDASVEIANLFPDLYGVASAPVAELMQKYYNPTKPDEPVDPRIRPIVDLLEFGQANGIYNLQHAHWAKNGGGGNAQAVIDAEKRGRESLLNQQPTVGLAGARGQGSGGTNAPVVPGSEKYDKMSDREISDIAHNGELWDPNWTVTDDTGRVTFVRENIPEVFHKHLPPG